MPRITPPDSYEFTRTLPIAALNDTEADCLFGTEGSEVMLWEAMICDKLFLASELREWLGASEVALLEDMAQDYWMGGAWADAEQDWLASVADAQNEARDDD